ncbi:MAG: hypothetical protein Q8L27_02140 [archaeon]|nr:hypothetical protein [archaeon]
MAIRKIMSAEERELKERRNKQIIVIILGLIMIISSASYAFMSFEKTDSGDGAIDKKNYMGIDFVKTEYATWKFNIQGYDFETNYLPEETANISTIITKNIQTYSGKVLYLGMDNIEDYANYGKSEIVKNLDSFILRYQDSCLTSNCTENYPIKNCTDNKVITFKKAEKSKITEQDSCIIVEYMDDEEIMASDALIFKLLGLRQ